jgi:hypothetical protein
MLNLLQSNIFLGCLLNTMLTVMGADAGNIESNKWVAGLTVVIIVLERLEKIVSACKHIYNTVKNDTTTTKQEDGEKT